LRTANRALLSNRWIAILAEPCECLVVNRDCQLVFAAVVLEASPLMEAAGIETRVRSRTGDVTN
jgi:hypothetical protein